MNGKELLYSMSHVEEKLINEAETVIPLRVRKRRSLVFLVAAVISLLGVVAFASSMPTSTEGWFASFFASDTQEKAELELTENQSAILHAGLAEINQSVTDQGYTITLESGLCDGKRALIKCRVDAPEGVVLSGRNYGFDYSTDISYSGGVPWDFSASSRGSFLLEDNDPNDNSVVNVLDLIIQPSKNSGASLADGSVWTITISSISELTGYDENVAWNTLCEGTWEFQVVFEDELLVTESVELLDEPVRCDATMFVDNRLIHSKKLPLKAKVFSFELKPLTATISNKRPLIAKYAGVDLEKPIYLVMKDGSKVEVRYRQSLYRKEYDESIYVFDRPVSVEDVEFIEFPGAGKVPVHENEQINNP